MGLLDASVSDQPEAVATALDQIPVVGDQQDAPGEGVQGLGQLLLARQIQVVGRFIEPEQMVARQREGEKQQPGPLPPAQSVHPLAMAGVGEARADQRLAPCPLRQGRQGVEGVAQGGVAIQLLQGLIVVSDAGAGVAVPAFPRHLRSQLTPALAQQGGLAGAIGAEQGDPVAGPQPEILGPQQGRQARGGAHLEGFQSQQGIGGQCLPVQLEAPGGRRRDSALLLLQTGDAFFHGLGLAHQLLVVILAPPDGEALAAGTQAVYLLLFVGPAQAGLLVLFGQRHSGLTAGQGEAVQLTISQDQGLLGDPVQQATVVGDQHEGAAPAQQKLLQPEQGGQVQVVAGFIEQQQVGLAQQGAAYLQPGVLAAAQGAGG
ncbi:hypothetical protein D3C81_775430 [compost metagenome]